MCGRFTLATSTEALAEQFALASAPPELTPSYNIAPGGEIAAVVADSARYRQLGMLCWGLVLRWSKDPGIGQRMINARAETVAHKNSFKFALMKRRCLILADGFYEWRGPKDGESGPKQPHYFRLASGEAFAFAGLWESWEGNDGRGGTRGIHSATIITTQANVLVGEVHYRMPVILRPESYATWLDTAVQDPEELMSMLAPYPPEELESYPVSTRVNRPANDDPRCIEPVGGARLKPSPPPPGREHEEGDAS